MEATVEIAEREDPAIPAAVPISCWSRMAMVQIGRTSASFHPMNVVAIMIRAIAVFGVSGVHNAVRLRKSVPIVITHMHWSFQWPKFYQ